MTEISLDLNLGGDDVTKITQLSLEIDAPIQVENDSSSSESDSDDSSGENSDSSSSGSSLQGETSVVNTELVLDIEP